MSMLVPTRRSLLMLMIAISAVFILCTTVLTTQNYSVVGNFKLKQITNQLINKVSSYWRVKEATGLHALTHTEISQRFDRRLQTLHEACKLYGNSSKFRLMGKNRKKVVGPFRPVVNVSMVYCPIQKTGSTTWSGVLNSINREMRKRKLQATKAVPNEDKEVSVVFVRDPYARLLSAYVDKLFSPNTLFWAITGKYIIKTFRMNPSQNSLHCGHDVTFPEFIQYVIHAQETGAHRNGHFIPTHDHCDVCHRSFNYVGHLETIGDDMAYLLNIIQSPVNYTRNFDRDTLKGNANWVLKAMKTKIRKCMSMEEACHRLWKKWHIRGIISKTEPLPVTAPQAENISLAAFMNLSYAALDRSGPKAERKLQKTEALREAFASVPLEDRLKIRELLFLDFALFGFDPDPDFVFSQSTGENTGYSYFDLGTEQ